MAASATYILKSLTFKGTAIDGLQEIQFGQDGDVVSHNSDGQITISATFIDNIKGSVRVSSTNTGLASNANFDIGAFGSLVAVFQNRTNGKGAVAGQDKTLTAAESTVVRPGGSAPHADRGTFDLEFEVCDAEGVSPFVWS